MRHFYSVYNIFERINRVSLFTICTNGSGNLFRKQHNWLKSFHIFIFFEFTSRNRDIHGRCFIEYTPDFRNFVICHHCLKAVTLHTFTSFIQHHVVLLQFTKVRYDLCPCFGSLFPHQFPWNIALFIHFTNINCFFFDLGVNQCVCFISFVGLHYCSPHDFLLDSLSFCNSRQKITLIRIFILSLRCHVFVTSFIQWGRSTTFPWTGTCQFQSVDFTHLILDFVKTLFHFRCKTTLISTHILCFHSWCLAFSIFRFATLIYLCNLFIKGTCILTFLAFSRMQIWLPLHWLILLSCWKTFWGCTLWTLLSPWFLISSLCCLGNSARKAWYGNKVTNVTYPSMLEVRAWVRFAILFFIHCLVFAILFVLILWIILCVNVVLYNTFDASLEAFGFSIKSLGDQLIYASLQHFWSRTLLYLSVSRCTIIGQFSWPYFTVWPLNLIVCLNWIVHPLLKPRDITCILLSLFSQSVL